MTPVVDLGRDPGRLKLIYERDARQYLQSLPLEHFMESTGQSTQRKITVASFDVIERSRPDIQCFSELLIQYPRPGESIEKPARVVPDNMVFVHPARIEAEGSFMLPMQRVMPTLVLEYVSKSNERKDYQDNYAKYEQELQVPYYLVFHPENEDLRIFRLVEGSYRRLTLNESGRVIIPEMELEIGLVDGWVRFWFRGNLIPLTGELVEEVEEEKRLRWEAEQRAAREEQRAVREEQRAVRAERGQAVAETAWLAAEQARATAEQARITADQARSKEE